MLIHNDSSFNKYGPVAGEVYIHSESQQTFPIPAEVHGLQNFRDFSLAVCDGSLYCVGGANQKVGNTMTVHACRKMCKHGPNFGKNWSSSFP